MVHEWWFNCKNNHQQKTTKRDQHLFTFTYTFVNPNNLHVKVSTFRLAKGPFIKNVCKIFRKTNIFNPLIRTRTYLDNVFILIFLYEKLKNCSMQSFKECLFFVFCLFCLLLSNNTLYVVFYTYICCWNTFQYKYIIQITTRAVKQSHTRVTSKDICLLFHVLFLCLFSFCLDFSFTHLRHFLTFILFAFI